MTVQTNIMLSPLHKSVSIKNRPVEIEINLNHYFFRRVSKRAKKIDGVYATYPEGIFVFFKDNNGVKLGWKSNLININLITHATRSFSLTEGININFYSGNELLINVNYMTLYRFVRNPVSSLFDLLFPDEWWDYTQDLPGEVYCAFENNRVEHALQLMLKNIKV